MFRYIPLMWKNSLRNRRRSLLTIASVAASLCLLGVLMAIYHALFINEEVSPAQALRLITRNKISLTVVLPRSYGQKIATVPGVQEVMINQWFGGVYKDPKNFFARMAIEPAKMFKMFPEFELPDEQKKAFQRERAACLIGKALADKYNIKLNDHVQLQGDIFPVNLDLIVRGIYSSAENDEALYFDYEYLIQSLPSTRRDFAGTFQILADKPTSVDGIARTIDDMFRNSTIQTKTESERQFQLGFLSLIGNIKAFLLAICSAVTFTILLVSGNTMAMSVRERVKEVGILKTLGFTNGAVLGIILGEAAVISLLGGLIGSLIATVLISGVRNAPVPIAQLKTLTLAPPVALACMGVALAIGVVSAFIPAYNASRTSILDALKYSG